MARMTPFTVEHAGRKWSGTWEVDGKDVLVCSAWGSDREPIGRRQPERVAAGVLRALLERRRT
jgi:hypothetical protein